MSSKLLNTLVLFCVASICAEALGLTNQPEGWADVEIIVVTSDVVVCSRSVSGAEDELFALDTLGKKLLWRKSGYAVTRGETNGRGDFFIIASPHSIVSRKLKNGEVNWQTEIDVPTLTARTEPAAPQDPNLAAHPLTYEYRGPFIRGEKAFVCRHARRDSTLLHDDWLLFDAADGKLLHRDADACLGLAGDVVIAERDANSIVAVSSSDYGQRPIYREQTPGPLAAAPLDLWSGGPEIQYSHEGKCIFEITLAPSSKSAAAVYDSSSGKLTILEPVAEPNLPADWILLSDYAVSYSPTGRIAVYGLDGKLVRQYTLQPPTDASNDQLRFAGTSGNGSPIFRRAESLLVFDVPSLELTAGVKRQPNAPWGDIFIRRGSDIIYSVEGNTAFEKMPAEQLTRSITVNLILLKSGETLWTHTEEVTVEKRNAPS